MFFLKRDYVVSLEKKLGIFSHKLFYSKDYVKRLERLVENLDNVTFHTVPETSKEVNEVIEKIKNENLNRDIIYPHIINNDFNFDQETLNKCGYNFIRSIEYLIELINEKDDLFLYCSRDNKFYTNRYLIDSLSDIIYNEEYQKALKLENIEPNLNQWTNFLYKN
jgi:hypothetical protein